MKKYFIPFVFIMVLLASICVYAEGLNIEQLDLNGGFQISGNEKENSNVILYLCHKDEPSGSTLSLEAIDRERIEYVGQTKTDDDGNYSFTVSVAGGSEEYEVYLYSEGKLVQTGEISYSNNDEFKEKVGAITTLAKADKTEKELVADITAYIDDNVKAFGISGEINKIMGETEKTNMSALLYENYLKNEKLNTIIESDLKRSKEIIKTYAVIAALNGGKVENVIKYTNELNLKEYAIGNWGIDEVVTATMQRLITQRVSNQGITNEETLYQKLTEALILEVIKEPDGWGNVKRLLEDFEDFLSIDTDNTKDKVYQNMTGKTYDSKKAVKTAFENESESSGERSPSRTNSSDRGTKISIESNLVSKPAITPIATEDLTKQPVSFDDMEDYAWAEEAVLFLAEKEIIAGKAENKYVPEDSITRAEFAKLLCLVFELPEASADINFADVNSDDWYYPYVTTLVKHNIARGISVDRFGSEEIISRQDICVLITNALDFKDIELKKEVGTKTFYDYSAIENYAKEAVTVMQTSGIISGYTDNTFRPVGGTTRAEAAVILYRLYNSI
ncbi:MAG: S-layer homology domain-containing protein [Clostridia bacterium]|nr:S-layer homology domain-containing protein [Clostridia bacterium]